MKGAVCVYMYMHTYIYIHPHTYTQPSNPTPRHSSRHCPGPAWVQKRAQRRDPTAATAGKGRTSPARGAAARAAFPLPPRQRRLRSTWQDEAPWYAPCPLRHSGNVFGCFDVSSMRHHSSAEMLIIPLGSFLLFVMDFSQLYNTHFSS